MKVGRLTASEYENANHHLLSKTDATSDEY
jgi:hypothetical protein